MITVNFFNYAGHPDTVNKQLGAGTAINGLLRDNFNVINPVLTIRQQQPIEFNYCYIPDFKRYYFVSGVNVMNSDKTEIRLTLDVLKTYEAQILEATGTVNNSDNPDKYVSNRNNVFSRKPNFIKVPFPNTELFNADGTIIMVTIKGVEK